METHDLHTLFNPHRIAVIGASPDTKGIRGRFFDFLVRGGFEGDIVPVNPSYREIEGRACFPTIAAASEQATAPIDLAAIVIPANGVVAELERCAAAGVRNVLIVSSGFAEEGGERSQLQARIAAIGREAGMRIVGPNSEGFLNVLGRVSATFSPTVELTRGDAARKGAKLKRAAVIAQSGGVGFGVMHRGLKAGVAFSYAISTGNEADVTLADCLGYMVEDPHTDVIALFMESVRDVAKFEAACARALALDKPIVAIKVGRSDAGQRAAASHTASIAGWGVAYDAFFAKYAIVPCADLSESTAILGVLTTCSALKGNRVAVLTPSGGAGALISDTLERHGFALPVLSDKTQELIRPSIPSYATAQNPVDVTAGATRTGAYVRAADTLLGSDEIDLVVTVHSFTSESSVSVDPNELARGLPGSGKALTAFCYTDPSQYARARMTEAGIYVHADAQLMAGALAKALDRTKQVARLSRAPLVSQASELASRAVSALARAFAAVDAEVMCEYEVKAVLRACGIDAVGDVLCQSAEESIAAAERLGYPVALKIQSPAIMHKSEVGGVRIGLETAEAVRAAHRSILDAVAKAVPQAPIRGVLVQKMAPAGYEVIVGMIRDATFGPLMMVGFGGIAVELYKDVAYRPAPLSAGDAEALLRSLKSSALFDGFRGKPVVDLGPLAQLVSRLSHIVVAASMSQCPIAELELNPVIVHADGTGVTIADALLRRAH
jgi:acetate---CoA ligase (ADP-forming)